MFSRKSVKMQDRLVKSLRPGAEMTPSPKVNVLVTGTGADKRTVCCVSLTADGKTLLLYIFLHQDSQMSVSSAPQQDAAPRSPSDVASLKLLRYLQERVKQLRAENNTCSLGLSPAHTVPGDLSGSYLTTVRSVFNPGYVFP